MGRRRSATEYLILFIYIYFIFCELCVVQCLENSYLSTICLTWPSRQMYYLLPGTELSHSWTFLGNPSLRISTGNLISHLLLKYFHEVMCSVSLMPVSYPCQVVTQWKELSSPCVKCTSHILGDFTETTWLSKVESEAFCLFNLTLLLDLFSVSHSA